MFELAVFFCVLFEFFEILNCAHLITMIVVDGTYCQAQECVCVHGDLYALLTL